MEQRVIYYECVFSQGALVQVCRVMYWTMVGMEVSFTGPESQCVSFNSNRQFGIPLVQFLFWVPAFQDMPGIVSWEISPIYLNRRPAILYFHLCWGHPVPGFSFSPAALEFALGPGQACFQPWGLGCWLSQGLGQWMTELVGIRDLAMQLKLHGGFSDEWVCQIDRHEK